MNLPCLCSGRVVCTRCATRRSRQRMVDNKLAALAKDFVDIDDDQWCVLLYLHVQDDLDLLLFQGEAS